MPEVLHRREIAHLQDWAGRRPRKPLLIRGARQVGKSTLARELTRDAGLTLVAVDFERDPELREAFAGRDPARILALLKLLTGKTATAGAHLLFLDEIQAAPEALAALRYFHTSSSARSPPPSPCASTGTRRACCGTRGSCRMGRWCVTTCCLCRCTSSARRAG